METTDLNSPFELTSTSLGHLSETRKWTLFISILGFVFIGLSMTIVPVIFASSSSLAFQGGGLVTTLPLILIAVLYFFPIFFLLKFSMNSKRAILNSDKLAFEIALKYLKFHYRFMGILIIVMISIYFVAGLIFLITTGLK